MAELYNPEAVRDMIGEKRVYLCSPYSDPDLDVRRLRYQGVCKIAADLMRQHPDMMIFSPIAHSHSLFIYGKLDSGGIDFWWPYNKSWIDWSTDLYVADMVGRDESVGINDFEVPYARDTGKDIKWL